MKGRVLIAGFATRHVARSAFQAGYEVCAVDHFCDQDLAWYTSDHEQFDDLADLPHAIERICQRHTFDLFIPTSGAEELDIPLPRSGTDCAAIAPFMDKLETQHFFEREALTVPRLLPEGTYPAMIKPKKGAGGWRNAVIHDDNAMETWRSLYPALPYIRQEIVSGEPASVCCLATGRDAMAVAVNGQILRGSGESAYGFSGSITPFYHPLSDTMIRVAERAAARSGCRGTIGVDFVAGNDGVYAIEINPRFQGTVDTVEMATGCSLFGLHVEACDGRLPEVRPETRQYAVRTIIFADKDLTVHADLRKFRDIAADIPWPGTFLEEEQAIISVYGWGSTPDAARSLLDKHITIIRQYMR